jgi:hypothetical protein
MPYAPEGETGNVRNIYDYILISVKKYRPRSL